MRWPLPDAPARPGVLLVRADSAYYGYDVINTCRRAGARFSITARLTATVTRAITSIDEAAWTPIRYPNAIYDEDEQRWISDAEVAEIRFTAFTGRRRGEHVTARLIVRRVRRLNPKTVPAGQSQMFAVSRYHAVFTDSAESMLAAEATHRDHAIIEQVIAELKNGPLAHLPSGSFAANSAWLVCAAISHNLIHAAGVLAGGRHARARTATLRARLVTTPGTVPPSLDPQPPGAPRPQGRATAAGAVLSRFGRRVGEARRCAIGDRGPERPRFRADGARLRRSAHLFRSSSGTTRSANELTTASAANTDAHTATIAASISAPIASDIDVVSGLPCAAWSACRAAHARFAWSFATRPQGIQMCRVLMIVGG
jgi:hypothetical protein